VSGLEQCPARERRIKGRNSLAKGAEVSAMRLGRNDLCWCGSGKKYKRCHLDRESEERLQFPVIQDTIRKSTKQKVCFHPEASPASCSTVISAHTIQRSRVLGKVIGRDKHVLTFHPSYKIAFWYGYVCV